ncbi:MAG TPA: hypothetical protein VK211_20185 [Kamptonema sp.]|nr:hypothetical protein [Kamptonema sp.]
MSSILRTVFKQLSRSKKEEGRRKKEEGRRKKEECLYSWLFSHPDLMFD